MKKKGFLSLSIGLFLFACTCIGLYAVQEQDYSTIPDKSVKIKPGLDFEYSSMTMDLKEDEATADMTLYLFKVNCEFEFKGGLFLTATLGYAINNFKSMIFRGLPISVELDVGGVNGYLFGGSLRKTIAFLGDFEIEGQGDFVYNYGTEKSWTVPGLSVSGEVTGKPTWMRIIAGPRVIYKGFENLHPFASLNFYKIWGTFTMDQTIEDLTGQEEKKISGKNFINAVLGTDYTISESLCLKGQLELLPHSDGSDFGFMIGFRYLF